MILYVNMQSDQLRPAWPSTNTGATVSRDSLIDHAYDDLAHSLRVLLEAHYHANRGGLLFVDRDEAIGNIESALTGVLNAFHSLYDAIDGQLGRPLIEWYQTGALATILAIRNARHHNKANKIRTLYGYHARGRWRPDRMRQYVLIDFNSPEEGADTFDVYLSWADLKALLSLPRAESRLRQEACDVIRDYLGTARYDHYAAGYDLGGDRVFFNIVPLIVNAAAVITPLVKPYLSERSMESRTYATLFENMVPADMQRPDVACGPFVLPS
jgi:hypothetical protein